MKGGVYRMLTFKKGGENMRQQQAVTGRGTLLQRQGAGGETEGQPQEPTGLPQQRHTAIYPGRRKNPVQGFRH